MDVKLLIIVVLGVAIGLGGLMLLRAAHQEVPATAAATSTTTSASTSTPATASTATTTATSFTVRIENIAATDAIVTSDGSTPTFVISPIVWSVHTAATPLFIEGVAASGTPLERLAEDGNPNPLAQALASEVGVSSSGIVDTPVGADSPGVLTPGNAFEFTISAEPGMWLSFATMFGQSNDLFYAPVPPGIELFNSDGSPLSGDVTGQIFLWDAGTEVNQEPGLGIDQAPRQAAPDTGEDENGVIQPVNDGYTYPGVFEVLRVTVTPQV